MQQFTFKRDTLPILTVLADRVKDQQLFFICDFTCDDIEQWKAIGFDWTVQMHTYEEVIEMADDMNCQLYVFDGNEVKETYDFESAVKITVNQQISKNDTQNASPVYENGVGGEITGAGTIDPGEYCNLTFTPNPGYTFAGWFSNDGALLSQDEEYSFIVDHTLTIIARSNLQWYNVNLTSENESKGTVSVSGATNSRAAYGTELTVSFERKTGYTLDSFEVSNGDNTQDIISSPTKVIVNGNVTGTAIWSIYKVTIDAKVDPEGTGSWSDNVNSSLQEGVSSQITFTPGENYNFVNTTYATIESPTGEESTTSQQLTIDFNWYQGRKVTAHTSPKTYTVTLNANGGTVDTSTMQVVYNTAIGEIPTPTRNEMISTSYTFAGWYTAAVDGEEVNSSTVITSDMEIFAHWTETTRSYTLTYNANGGEVSPASKSVLYGAEYGDLPEPTKAATAQYTYTFAGWFTDAEAGTQVTSSTTMTTAGATIYAHWTATVNEYTVTVKAGYRDTDGTGDYTEATTGGTATGGGEVEYGNETVINASPATGYLFDGWYTALNDGVQASTLEEYDVKSVTEDITLYALFTKQYFNVNVTKGENVVTATPETQRVAYNGTSTTITATVSEAYNTPTFSISGTGTLNDAGNGTCTVSNITTNITVTASTTIKTFNVTVEANYRDTDNAGAFTAGTTGGTANGGGTINYGSDTTLTASPATGYTFMGWYEDNEQLSASATYQLTNITADREIEAWFQKNWFTVTYVAGDYIESVAPTSERVPYGGGISTGSTATLMTNTAQYAYSFDGWYGPDGAQLTTNIHVADIGQSITENKTVTAKGTRTTQQYVITIAVSPNGAGTTTNTLTADYGDNIQLQATPASGYVFDHWENSQQEDLGSTNPLQVTVTGTETYTAIFTVETVTLTVETSPEGKAETTGGGEYEIGETAEYGIDFSTIDPNYIYGGVYHKPTKTKVTMDTSKTVTVPLVTRTYAAVVNSNIEHCTVDTMYKSGAYNSQVVFNFTPEEGYQITGYKYISSSSLAVYNTTITATGNANVEAYKYGSNSETPDITITAIERPAGSSSQYELEVKSTLYSKDGFTDLIMNLVQNLDTMKLGDIENFYMAAKLPKGTRLIPAFNGNVQCRWITDNVGTGGYENYRYQIINSDSENPSIAQGYWVLLADSTIFNAGDEVAIYITAISPVVQAMQEVGRIEQNYDTLVPGQSGNTLTLTLDRNYCIWPVVEAITTT